MGTSTTQSEVRAGARAMGPVLVGLAPAGFAVGAAWGASSLPLLPGLLASATVYGASAQLLLVDLTSRGAGLGVLAAATAVASLRLALLGLGLGRQLSGSTAPARWLAALLLVDPAYLVADAGFGPGTTGRQRERFYLGAALTLWAGWQVAHAAGALMGSLIPAAWALDFALPLCLLGLLAPRLRDRAARRAALTAAAIAVAAGSAPLGTGLLLAAAGGLWIGTRSGGAR